VIRPYTPGTAYHRPNAAAHPAHIRRTPGFRLSHRARGAYRRRTEVDYVYDYEYDYAGSRCGYRSRSRRAPGGGAVELELGVAPLGPL